MAIQDQVRALLPRDALDTVLGELQDEFGVARSQIEVAEAEPGDYRDESPELELRKLVRVGGPRMVLGAIAGAILGAIVALAVPFLRDIAVVSVPLLALGGATATMTVATARGVQVARSEDDRGDEVRTLDEQHAAELQVLTIRGLRDRARVEDLLAARGARLLDTHHPRVGEDEPGARSADPGDDRRGPPAS